MNKIKNVTLGKTIIYRASGQERKKKINKIPKREKGGINY